MNKDAGSFVARHCQDSVHQPSYLKNEGVQSLAMGLNFYREVKTSNLVSNPLLSQYMPIFMQDNCAGYG